MLRFDDGHLEDLARLSPRDRTAFAAACAERLLPAHASYMALCGGSDTAILRENLDRLWADIDANSMQPPELSARIAMTENLLPDPDDDSEWPIERGIAEDAVTALLYALDCRKDGKVDQAGAAAKRAYEALETILLDRAGNQNDLGVLESVRQHVSIQTELERQKRDLGELVRGTIPIKVLRERARLESQTFLPISAE